MPNTGIFITGIFSTGTFSILFCVEIAQPSQFTDTYGTDISLVGASVKRWLLPFLTFL